MKPLQNYGKIGRIHLFAAIVEAYGLILVISVGANFILLSCFRFVGLFLAGVVFLAGAHAVPVSDPESNPLVKKLFVFDLPSQSLKNTLVAFGVQAGVSIIVPSQTLSAYESKPVVGRFGLGRALDIILSNSPLSFRVMPGSSTVVIEAPKKKTAIDTTLPVYTSKDVEDVLVVSVRHWDEALLDVPISLSVVSGEILDREGVQDLVQLGSSLANTTLQVVRGTNTTLAAYVRGIGQDEPLAGFDTGVGIYVDDIFLNRPQGAVLDIYDVERIEVLRGPQGTLYGRNTIGGAIKYVTKKLTDDPSLSLKTYLGSYSQKDFILSGSIPFSDGRLKVGSSFGVFMRDGFGNNLLTGEDNYNKNIFVGRGSIEIQPSDDIFIRIAGDFNKDKSNPRSGRRFILAEGEAPLNNIYDTRAGGGLSAHPVNKGEESARSVVGSLSWSVSSGVIFESMTAYRQDKSRSPLDFDSTERAVMDVPVTYKNRQFSQEVRFKFESSRLKGVLGAFYLNANAFNAYDVELVDRRFGQYTSGDVDVKSRALFSTLNYNVSKSFNVSLGARYSTDVRDVVIVRDSFALIPGVPFVSSYFGGNSISLVAVQEDINGREVVPRFSGVRKDRQLTPRVSLSWQPKSSLHIYGTYGGGFRSGGFDPRGDFGNESIRSGFEPETVDAYELGLKSKFFNGVLTANVALFHSDYRNIQVNNSLLPSAGENSAVIGKLTNSAEANISGVELDVSADMSNYLSVAFSAGILDAKFVKYIDAEGGDVASDRTFANTPDSTLSLSLIGIYPFAEGSLSWRGTVHYRSEVSLSTNPMGELRQTGYILVNGHIVWESDSEVWQFGLYGMNLSDERYKVAGYYFPEFDVGTFFYGDPRTIKVSLKRSF